MSVKVVKSWKWKDKSGREHIVIQFENGDTKVLSHKRNVIIGRPVTSNIVDSIQKRYVKDISILDIKTSVNRLSQIVTEYRQKQKKRNEGDKHENR